MTFFLDNTQKFVMGAHFDGQYLLHARYLLGRIHEVSVCHHYLIILAIQKITHDHFGNGRNLGYFESNIFFVEISRYIVVMMMKSRLPFFPYQDEVGFRCMFFDGLMRLV